MAVVHRASSVGHLALLNFPSHDWVNRWSSKLLEDRAFALKRASEHAASSPAESRHDSRSVLKHYKSILFSLIVSHRGVFWGWKGKSLFRKQEAHVTHVSITDICLSAHLFNMFNHVY